MPSAGTIIKPPSIPSVDDGQTFSLPLPLAPGKWAILQAPFPITESQWQMLETALKAQKAALVMPDDRQGNDSEGD